MRKILLIAGILLILAIIVIMVIRQNYKGSPDYNYIAAKLDIGNGNIRIINIGYRIPCTKDSEIDLATAKYGFKNIYIGYDTTAQKIKGITNYNDLMEGYLALRNGNNWRRSYQKELDSLYKLAFVQDSGKQKFAK